MVSRRQQLREAANENARLNAENNRLRAALDGAQQEKAEWQRRAERFANDLGVAKADAVRAALGGSGVLADAQRDIERLRAENDGTAQRLNEAQREVRDLERLLAEARREERPELAAGVAGPEVMRLRRDLREMRELNAALQKRLTEAERLNDELSREAVTRAGTLEVAR